MLKRKTSQRDNRRTQLQKVRQQETVLAAARRRFAELYARFDQVAVSFSGGKDSTVCLQLALEAARNAKRLPVEVVFFDEEAIPPETVEYVERCRANPEINLKWACVEIKHRNACSREEPYWFCWDREKKDLWCRPMPDGAITEFDGFHRGDVMPNIAHRIYPRENGTLAMIRGLRASESIHRLRSVTKRYDDNWINNPSDRYAYQTSPIYDWTTADVWTAPHELGWDYNRAYDLMSMAGIKPNDQRCCPPYGEEPLQSLWIFAVCWPDLWHKMIKRVPGASAAGRYCGTELYGGKPQLPPGMTWRQWAYAQLELYPERYKRIVAGNVATLLDRHTQKTDRPITETEPDPVTGLCWRSLAVLVSRGDFKRRRGYSLGIGVVEKELLEENPDGCRY